MILAAYDAGIDDFALASAEDFELVIRTVNNIKHNSIKLKALRNLKLLEQLNVVDELTGLYNYNFAKQVIENVIDDNLLDDGSFVALAPSEESKTGFSVEKWRKLSFHQFVPTISQHWGAVQNFIFYFQRPVLTVLLLF